MASKKVVVVGGGKPPRQFDISTPPPPAIPIPGPLPQVGKPFLEMLEEAFRDLPAPTVPEGP